MVKRILIVVGLVLGIGLAFTAVSLADSSHGDCKNDNAGNHNGYSCSDEQPVGDPGQGAGQDPHGDCKNDNAGNHNGYDCDGTGGGNPGGGGGNGGGGTPIIATPVTTTVVDFAPTAAPQQAILGQKLRACTSRRGFTIHIRRYRGVKYRSARITFNGRVLASRKGSARVAAPIVLKGLPRGTFTIRIRVTTSKGRVLKGKRVYHTCVAKRPNHPAPRL